MRDTEEDLKVQEEIRVRARYSIAVLEKTLYLRTGRYVRINPENKN